MTRERFDQLRKLYESPGYLIINECLDEIARLSKAIEDAPHDNRCGFHFDDACDCRTGDWIDSTLGEK